MSAKFSMQTNLSQSQHLSMTPALQQAIRLLQLSTLELQKEIQEALDSNPLLEAAEPEKHITVDQVQEKDNLRVDEAINENDIPRELPVDTEWGDIYLSGSNRSSNPEDTPNYENITTVEENLHDHLAWQLHLTAFNETEHAIATAIIDAVNDDGFLACPLEEIIECVGCDHTGNFVTQDAVEAVLKRIQLFDPVGVASRNLSECLSVQLDQHPQQDDPIVISAKMIVKDYIELLGQHNYKQIMRSAKISQDTLQEAITLIQSLAPRPGECIISNEVEYVIPDVIVKKINGRWTVELNQDAVPKLRINANYASLVQRAKDTPDNNFLRDNLQEARWFIKSLVSRNETLLRVATCITELQKDFFEHGEEAMKPLVLHDIASQLEMHESTISRVTTQKYMHTPRGVFELKYFFSSHVTTQAGGECSATAIRAVIKKLVAAENPQKPLSDNKIAQILSDQGINVARRTIAKYREALKIPPSNERKTLVGRQDHRSLDHRKNQNRVEETEV